MSVMLWIAAVVLAQPASEAPPVEAIPVWIEHPTVTSQDYPPTALAAGLPGTASLMCSASSEGVPTDCSILNEDPAEYGFGTAAIQVVERSRMNPDYVASIEPPATFQLRISFVLQRSEPVIIIPGSQTGAATLQCTLSEAGLATGCTPLFEAPTDQGVGQRAIGFLESGPLPDGLLGSTMPGQSFTVQIQFGEPQR